MEGLDEEDRDKLLAIVADKAGTKRAQKLASVMIDSRGAKKARDD